MADQVKPKQAQTPVDPVPVAEEEKPSAAKLATDRMREQARRMKERRTKK